MAQTEEKYERITLSNDRDGGVNVHGWGTYPRHSVLAGQPMKVILDGFPDEAAARKAYPQAQEGFSSKWTEPPVSLNHLPGEDDMVAGGAYPDDYDDGPN